MNNLPNRDLLLYAVVASGFIVALSVISRASADPTPLTTPAAMCPDPSAGETDEDCPWAAHARKLMALPGATAKKTADELAKLSPALDRSLREDAKRKDWRWLWGRSINYDELAKATIVDPGILEGLALTFGIKRPMNLHNVQEGKSLDGTPAALLGQAPTTDPSGHELAHAGLEHTYGYLFSVLKTQFGYKRARWVSGEIEKGFGLPVGTLGPTPASGTLFANVTYFAGRIAFRGIETQLSKLKKGEEGLPKELRTFDFAKLSITRLEEAVEAKDSGAAKRRVLLRTDLVPFLHPQKNTHLLVYSISDPSTGGDLLITAFPVNSGFVDTVTRADGLGDNKPVQTRYNGFVEGVTGSKLNGTRKLIKGNS